MTTICMTTCTFLERYLDRKAYSVIKKSGNEVNCWPKSPWKCKCRLFRTLFRQTPPHRSVIPHIFYVNPPIFGKLYPFGVRFQHKTKKRPRNVLDTEIEPNQSHFLADFMELSMYLDHSASFERGFCNIFKCTRVLFLLLCLPKALHYHLTVYKHVCMVGNASISANRRICGFTHIQVCCVRKGFIYLNVLLLIDWNITFVLKYFSISK